MAFMLAELILLGLKKQLLYLQLELKGQRQTSNDNGCIQTKKEIVHC